ncbi:MAG: hypothetical protein R3202_11615, partial [Candidatus Competibacterales bacterium]|nr:hypothetical protein [Candidatus Competibacterales bacterium]
MSVPVYLVWSAERLADGIELLARAAGYPVAAAAPVVDPLPPAAAAARLGLELEPVDSPYPERHLLLRHAGPAVFTLPPESGAGHLLLLRSGPRRAVLLGTDLNRHRVVLAQLSDWLLREVETPERAAIEPLLERADVPPERRERACRALLDERLAAVQLRGGWLLRLTPASGFWSQLRHARMPQLLGGLIAAHAGYQLFQILGWWLIAHGALAGEIEPAWVWAWALLLLTGVPFELLTVWTQSRLTIGFGQLLKPRLLFGALQLRGEEVRGQGIGQFLGRVLEAETLETLVLGGGFSALMSLIGLGAATVILALGAGGWPHALLLLLWFGVALVLSWRFHVRSLVWRRGHREMINALIERMVGHRTRLAQEDPRDWHHEEDQRLAGYLQLSQTVDGELIRIGGLVQRGWLLLGLLGLAYPLLTGPPAPALIAISLGGILLASQAFAQMAIGVESLVGVL